jgi:hypothetical protein
MSKFILSASPGRSDDALAVASVLSSEHTVYLDLATMCAARLTEEAYLRLAENQETWRSNVDAILALPICSCTPEAFLYQPGTRTSPVDGTQELPVYLATEELVDTPDIQLSIFRWQLDDQLEVRIRNPMRIVH